MYNSSSDQERNKILINLEKNARIFYFLFIDNNPCWLVKISFLYDICIRINRDVRFFSFWTDCTLLFLKWMYLEIDALYILCSRTSGKKRIGSNYRFCVGSHSCRSLFRIENPGNVTALNWNGENDLREAKNPSYSAQASLSGGCTASENPHSLLHRTAKIRLPKRHGSSFGIESLVHFFRQNRKVNETTGGCTDTTNKYFCICPHFLWDIVLLILCGPAPFFFFPLQKTTKGALSYPLTSFEMHSHYRLFRILLFIFCITVIPPLKGKDYLEKGK